jgi:hypothetical protein
MKDRTQYKFFGKQKLVVQRLFAFIKVSQHLIDEFDDVKRDA